MKCSIIINKKKFPDMILIFVLIFVLIFNLIYHHLIYHPGFAAFWKGGPARKLIFSLFHTINCKPN